MLGRYEMSAFDQDPRPLGVTQSAPTPGGTDITFSQDVDHVRIGSGWATWSHGDSGDVCWTEGATSLTMTLPPATSAFYFYAEPNPFATFTVTATTQDGTT